MPAGPVPVDHQPGRSLPFKNSTAVYPPLVRQSFFIGFLNRINLPGHTGFLRTNNGRGVWPPAAIGKQSTIFANGISNALFSKADSRKVLVGTCRHRHPM